jgi:hypothetical protein
MMAGSIGEIRVRRDRLGTSRWAASTEENDGSTARWGGWRAGDGRLCRHRRETQQGAAQVEGTSAGRGHEGAPRLGRTSASREAPRPRRNTRHGRCFGWSRREDR